MPVLVDPAEHDTCDRWIAEAMDERRTSTWLSTIV
jgi:hypothetical protein